MNNVDCIGCHQLGNEAKDAWVRRIQSGQSGDPLAN
jgi:hypothetical protein